MSQFRHIFSFILLLANGLVVSQTISNSLKYPSYIDTTKLKSYQLKGHDTIKVSREKVFDIKKIGGMKDSLQQLQEPKKQFSDSVKNQKKKLSQYKKFALGGSVSNQFDYGAIPYYMAGNNFPTNLFKSNGNINIRLSKIPLIADYFYSNPKYISGLNNYFTIRFDANEFQNLMNKDYLDKTKPLKTKLDSLSYANQKLKQQLALLENQKLHQIPSLDTSKFKSPIISTPSVPVLPDDSIGLNPDKGSVIVTPYINSIDSIKNIYGGLDTSQRKVNDLKNKITETEQVIENLKQKIAIVENPKQGISPGSTYSQTKFLKFMSGVKRFEVGMCYPSYSTFMINQMAIKGINTGYATETIFINASAGKTVVNYSIQPTNNVVLNQIQQLTSLLDWSKNPNEKKIGALKFGYGKENKTYIAIGGLFGKGTTSPTSSDVKNNLVIEIDGRCTYKFFNFEAAVAKSFLTDQNSSPINSEIAGNAQKTNWDRSLQGKIFGTIPKTKTKFSTLYRIVEPFFKSFGVGFMRSDIRRYETKLEQPFGNKFKIGFNYRRDEDNLKNLFAYKTILENYTYYTKCKFFKKRMDLTLNYTDIIQRINNSMLVDSKIIRSNIKTAILSYSPKLKKIQSTNTIIANLYELNDGFQKNQLENYSFSSFNIYRKWQLNSLNSFIHNTIRDSLNFTNAVNNTLEIGYQFSEKFRVMIGGKHAYELNSRGSEFGYSATITWRLHKLLNFELKAEKLVIGDFMNTLNYASLKQYPYYGYVKLVSVF